MSKELKPHPLGAIFPQMSDEEYAALKKSMKTDGFDPAHPIILYEGMILDGNHRYTAAKAAKVTPPTKEFKGDDPIAFVIQENLHRRNLTPSQSAALGAELMEMMKQREKEAKAAAKAEAKASRKKPAKAPKKAKGNRAARAAKVAGVSERSVNAAAALKKNDPEAFKEVQSGEKSLHAATKGVEEKKAASTRQSDAYGAATELIDKVCGENWSKTIEKKISAKEIIKMSGLEHNEMVRIKPFIEAGWTLKSALGYKSTQLTAAHTIRHAIHRAIEGGGRFTLDVDAEGDHWIVEVTRKTTTTE